MNASRRDRPPSEAIRRLAARGMTLTEGVHRSGSSLPWHDHAGATLCFVLDGAFAEYLHGEVLDCRPSTFKLTPGGERHWNRFHLGDVRGLLVELDPAQEPGLGPLASVLSRAHHSRGGVPSQLARRLYAEFLTGDDAAELAMEGLLLELLACLARSRESRAAPVAQWARRAHQLLHDTPSQRHSLGGVAAEVGVHPATLARGFRRAYGCSLGQMQRHLRLEAAAQDLGGSDRPIAAIAQDAGFYDQSHFSNAFRAHVGLTPQQYRSTVRAQG